MKTSASQQLEPTTVNLAGGRTLALDLADPDLLVVPRTPDMPLSLTGPFDGALIGQSTLRCNTPGILRADCIPTEEVPDVAMVTPPAIPQGIPLPAGSTIISTVLTWSATQFIADLGDAVTVQIWAPLTDTLVGSSDVASALPVTAIPAGAGLQVRVADITELNVGGQSVAQWLASGFRLAVTDLAADPVATLQSPAGGWTMSAAWTLASNPDVPGDLPPVNELNIQPAGKLSHSVDAPLVEILPAGPGSWSKVILTTFATDPWAKKSLTSGTYEYPDGNFPAFFGIDANRQNGFSFDALTVTGDTQDQPVYFHNLPAPGDYGKSTVDQLWVGPVLGLRSIS